MDVFATENEFVLEETSFKFTKNISGDDGVLAFGAVDVSIDFDLVRCLVEVGRKIVAINFVVGAVRNR